MTSKNNSTLKSSENIVQPANPVNPFNPPVESITSANLQPSNLSLPHIVQSVNQSQSTSNMLCTSRPSTIVTKGKLQSDFNPLEPVATEQSKSSNNNSNSKESLAQNVGIKIAVGLPENNNNTTKESNTTQHQSTSIEKYLSEWSVDLKEIDVPMNTTNIVLLITGTLLNDDQTTVIEKCHNAGILVSRKDNNLVKTKNGIYRLIGNIARGSPDVLYEKILVAHGIPKTWKYILNKLYNADKGTKKKQFNFILDSPAKPFKLMKNINLDKSLTRSGKIYKQHCNVLDTKNTNRKKKSLIFDPSGSNNSEHRKCLPLCVSTPKKPKKQASILEIKSQILKKNIVQNIVDTTKETKSINKINDSINLIKKRQTSGKKPVSIFVKSEKNTTEPKQSSVNNSEVLNSFNNTKQSTRRTSINSSRTMYSLDINKHQSSINSTKSSVDHSKLKRSEKKEKSLNQVKQKTPSEKIIPQKKGRVKSPQINSFKPVIFNDVTCSKSNKVGKEKKSKIINSEKEYPKGSSAAPCIFDDVDFTDFGDMSNFNSIPSPRALSLSSSTDMSRSVTPPFFSDRRVSSPESVVSEPPTLLSKYNEAIGLKRIRAPEITLEEDLRKIKKNHKQIDFKSASNKMKRIIQYGLHSDEEDYLD